MDLVLDVRDMNVTYRQKKKAVKAVAHVSFTLARGDSLGIVGESGSGKSTLAMGILGLLPEKTAEVSGKAFFLGSTELLGMTQEERNRIRWTQMAVVFQNAMNALSPVHRIHTIFEDIYHVHEPSADKETIKARTTELLRLVNLPERVYNLYPHEMSGGMSQRVAIALSLLHHPQLLIFDEATTALDVVTQGQILEEIVNMEQTLHTTRIMITHDMSVVASSCKQIAVMYAGELLETGRVADVMKHPQHPYTEALLEAFPALRGEQHRLSSIPGVLPDLAEAHPACIFAPRCPYAGARCKREKPQLLPQEGGSQVKCFRYEGGVS